VYHFNHKPPHLQDTWRKLATKVPLSPHGHRPPPWPDASPTPEQELSALTAFMVALPQNILPTDIDPSRLINPQLVLDFDTPKLPAEGKRLSTAIIHPSFSFSLLFLSWDLVGPPLPVFEPLSLFNLRLRTPYCAAVPTRARIVPLFFPYLLSSSARISLSVSSRTTVAP
jgi:hypothetical protein